MTTYTKRVQAVLTEEQYELLQRLSQEQGKPISVLIREAIEQQYFQKALLERRRQALQRLLALDAPIADWEQMEAEIIQGAVESPPPDSSPTRRHG
ncbi:MAG: ribbon-helix-helix protein, CopG family [Candidatus Bipolaricaulia bacterium]